MEGSVVAHAHDGNSSRDEASNSSTSMTDTQSDEPSAAAAAAAAGIAAGDREPAPASPSHSNSNSNRDGAASPTHSATNKRHITTVLNPYAQPSRTAPSPPKSPVRLRAGGGGGTGSSGNSSASSDSESSSRPRSPIRMSPRDRHLLGLGHASSSACHSPTRSGSTASHGLPASPQTPTRTRSLTQQSSGSCSPPLGSGLHGGTRSPIGAFWFPQGLPPSPGSKLHAQSTLSQLSLLHPHGLDLAALEQLTSSVLKLPKYCAPYVQQQCLNIQQHKAELQALVRENRVQELASKRLQRRMQLLRRGGIAGRTSNRSSLGTLSAAINQASLTSGTDMSVDDSGGMPIVVHAPTDTAGASPSAAAAPAHALISPTSLSHLGRSRNVSTASTSSSVLTTLSAPSSPPSNNERGDSDVGHDSCVLDASNESLLSPLSISRQSRAGPRSAPSSANSSLLQVSSLHGTDLLDEVDEDLEEEEAAEAAAAAAAGPEQRVLHQTFSYYYQHHLEKFKDPNTRFFRVLLGAVDYLMDAPGDSGSPTAEVGDMSALSLALDSGASPTSRTARPRRLNVASPRVSVPILATATASPVAPAAPSSASPLGAALQRHHFAPLLDAILSSHPGLEFLQQPEFQAKYAQTVIERIFYTLDSKGHGRLSLADLKRSNLLAEIAALESEPDINRSVHFFSYQHFYVLYCKFWELDSPDHDGFLSLKNLLDYENGALSHTICQRIIDACPQSTTTPATAGTAQHEATEGEQQTMTDSDSHSSDDCSALSASDAPRMDYLSFISFMLAEVDKTTPQSLSYWFRLLDLDHDRVLSLYELDHFWAEQGDKIQQLSSDTVSWRDIVCQLLDMIKGGSDAGGNAHGAGALPPASAALHRNVSGMLSAKALAAAPTPNLSTRASSDPTSFSLLPRAPGSALTGPPASSSCSSSSLRYEFSSCHITRKDLARSGLAEYFLNLFFNLQRFLSHESRDPVKARQRHEAQEQGISEWEVYAGREYNALVANEELQARAAEQQQQQHLHDEHAFEHGQQQCEEDDDGMSEAQHAHVHVQRSSARQEGAQARSSLGEDADAGSPHTPSHEPTGGDDSDMAVHDVNLHEPSSGAAATDAHSSHEPRDASESLSAESRELMQQRWGIGDRAVASGSVRVVSGAGGPNGAAPHCFFVHDVDGDSPIEAAHDDEQQTMTATEVAQAHQPVRTNGNKSAHSPVSPTQQATAAAAAAAHRHRLREEERAYLELQRKIHSSPAPNDAALSPSHRTHVRPSTSAAGDDAEAEEEEEAASPTPISIPNSAGASPQLAMLHLHSPSPAPAPHATDDHDADAQGEAEPSGASVSPTGATQHSSSLSPHIADCSSSAVAPLACAAVVSSNKENALPALSPLARRAAAPVASASLKRQLFTQTAADKQPLSPTRAAQTYQH